MKALRLIFILFLLLCSFWVCGLMFFIKNISSDNYHFTKTDAIIVLTGGSGRLESGIKLLKEGAAEKLFVSGVGHGFSIDRLVLLNNEDDLHSNDWLKNNTSLGYEAETTKGNAAESIKWLQENKYKSITLVTANYHMPRSLNEFKKVMPDIKIIPYPVFPDNVKLQGWFENTGSRRLIIAEYNKFLVSMVNI